MTKPTFVFPAVLFLLATAPFAEEKAQDPFEASLEALLQDKPLKDTAAIAAEIQRRLEWGQPDDRHLEAQGRLAFAQGRWLEALAALQKLPQPGPRAMEILAECWARKGERYEAAAWNLKAALRRRPRRLRRPAT
jgi:Flp pilus assembly protein TadD